MTQHQQRVHLTFTGPDAGTPFCGCDKAAARAAGDTFAHVPYSNLAEFFARPEICPACRAAWDAAGDTADDTEHEPGCDIFFGNPCSCTAGERRQP